MPFAYTRHNIPNGRAGTHATVREVVRLIQKGTQTESARLAAVQAVSNCPWKDKMAEAKAIFAWIRANIRFTYDPEGAELLQDVDAITLYRAGDCDDLTILGGSMLRSVGIPVRIVIIASDPSAPDLFNHIYLQVEIAPERWIGFDPSVIDSRVGWEPPRFTRKETFPIEG